MDFEHLEQRYLDNGRLNFEEFKDYFLNYMPEKLITYKFYDNNTVFCDSVIMDCWYQYMNYELVDITVFCKVAESIFVNLFRYKPILDDSEYED